MYNNKISILLLYNLGMRYRLNFLSTQSAQLLLRYNLGSSQLLISRKDTRSHATRELSARHYCIS